MIFIFCTLVIIAASQCYLVWPAKSRTVDTQKHTQQDIDYSAILCTYNEENNLKNITKLIQTLLADDHCLRIVIVDNFSDDDTFLRLKELQKSLGKDIYLFSASGGKSAAQNVAIKHCVGEVVLLVDADIQFTNASVSALLHQFRNPMIGTVSGNIIFENHTDKQHALLRGLFWKYEQYLRNNLSKKGLLITASGPFMSVRRSIFPVIPQQYGDDCYIPLYVRSKGYLNMYCEQAQAQDKNYAEERIEFNARRRMVNRNFSCSAEFILLFFRMQFSLGLALICHKFIRWCMPFFALFIILAGLQSTYSVWFQLLILSCIFMSLLRKYFAGIRKSRFVSVYNVILGINVAFVLGVLDAIRKKSVTRYKNV